MATPHSSRQTKKHTNHITSARQPQTTVSLLGYLFLALIHFYRYCISPFLAPRCRFYPTCSQYGLEAIRLHGAFKGSWLTLKRILRCHPLSQGGDDPVPPKCDHQDHSQ
ncbi:hypothetical protein EV693_1029 [Nicoletella semolina]|uniref:Putative membrane protein insertion efficiency factor n=1 Tax=Nicoletella semolina TaxID=271160 RepID=A0A4R2NBI2_9PAST|nr:membrane protein insertion efficiency factor YidD [Nicoletella semolina]TCP18332.1 hypothetical protein EV693_1029 [Nicoletella semolina]